MNIILGLLAISLSWALYNQLNIWAIRHNMKVPTIVKTVYMLIAVQLYIFLRLLSNLT